MKVQACQHRLHLFWHPVCISSAPVEEKRDWLAALSLVGKSGQGHLRLPDR